MKMVLRTGVLILAALVSAPLSAKTNTADVLALMEKSFGQVRDYKADAVMNVNTPQLHVKDSRATIYYKRPDRVKVVPKDGFAVIPDEAVPGDAAKWIRDNFTPSFAGTQIIAGQPAYVLNMTAKTPSVPATMRVWVEKSRGVIIATESKSSEMTMKSSWKYARVDGKYWLASEVRIDMSGMMAPAVYNPHKVRSEPPKTGSGSAVVTIKNYVANRGIPDSVFKKRK
jgi:hypothetical protein